jgi:hypothetical protein
MGTENWAEVTPMPGQGLLVRNGGLVLICADTGSVRELIALVDEVADAGSDGAALVRRVAALLAADDIGRFPDLALAGPSPSGVGVLVSGAGTAEVVLPDSVVRLSAADAITAVNRLFPGPVDAVTLSLPGAGAPDPRLRLDSGVIAAAGVVIQVSGRAELPYRPIPHQAPPPPPLRQPTAETAFVASVLVPGAEPDPDEVGVAVEVDERPSVRGIYCANGHFNDPVATLCRMCGVPLDGQTRPPVEGVRPALGVLLLDDGSSYMLDLDYVVGREPQADPQVAAGQARPLRLTDPEGVVSRRHVHIALMGWDVQVFDLGSSNGTQIRFPGEADRRQLPPGQPVSIRPGTEIGLGRRWIRYEALGNP